MTPATSTARRERKDTGHKDIGPNDIGPKDLGPTRARTGPSAPGRTAAPPARPHAAEAVLVVDLRINAGGTIGAGASSVRTAVESFGGAVAAALGTHVVGVFPADRVHDAIGAAVTVQRQAARSRDSMPDRRSSARSAKAAQWNAVVSVAVGPRPRAETFADLGLTAVGPGVDLALELCRRGVDATVLADDVAAGQIGKALPVDVDRRGWTVGERRVLVGEGDRVVSCREISFDLTDGGDPEPSVEALVLRGNGGSTTATPRSGPRRDTAVVDAPDKDGVPARRRAWSSGRVCCWFSDRGRGVISSSTGQEFYVDRRFLVVGGELDTDRTVFFVPRDPVARGRNPVAGAVLVEGTELEARIEHVDERGFGFAQLSDTNGTKQLLLVDLTGYGQVAHGDWMLVRVERADHGPVGRPV